jgi:hypothetical protein
MLDMWITDQPYRRTRKQLPFAESCRRSVNETIVLCYEFTDTFGICDAHWWGGTWAGLEWTRGNLWIVAVSSIRAQIPNRCFFEYRRKQIRRRLTILTIKGTLDDERKLFGQHTPIASSLARCKPPLLSSGVAPENKSDPCGSPRIFKVRVNCPSS